MAKTVSFKRLILRQVSPMVIRPVSVSDHMPLSEFHDVFRIILGWNGDLGYIPSCAWSGVQQLSADDAVGKYCTSSSLLLVDQEGHRGRSS